MAQQILNPNSVNPDDKLGDTPFDYTSKANSNFTELYENLSSQAQNVTVVNSESDFPLQDATTITLEANKKTVIGNALSTSKTIIPASGSSICSINPFSVQLTYTGTGNMFQSTNVSWEMCALGFSCASGTVFSCSGTAADTILMIDSVCVAALDVGSFTGMNTILQNSGFFGITNQGITTFGAINILSISKLRQQSTNSSHIALNLGTATFDNLEIANYEPEGPAGSIAISGLTGSANINSDRIATVNNSTLNGGAMTPLSSVSPSDIRWSFNSNSGVPDSRNAADSFLTTIETVTIATAGVFVQVNGSNWLSTVSDRFTSAATGVVTYNGERDIPVKISGYATVAKVGGGTDEIEVRFALNGTTLERSGGTTQNADPTSVPLEALVTLSNGDEINFYVANNTSTSNIEVTKASLVVVSA